MNKSIKFLATTLIALFILPSPPPAHAQASRQCASTAADPDGDGYGWEWNADINQLASCVITKESYTPPSPVFNRETGEEIRLIRPYWNANRDIAGKNISCKGYYFDETEGRYTNEYGTYDSNLYHDALPLSPPYMAAADYDTNPYHIFPDMVIYKVWTVIDGRYIGPMMGRMSVNYTAPIFDWLEIIEPTATQPAGIRIWDSDPTYRECFDKSGQPFGPTGFIGEQHPTEPSQNKTLIATGTPAPEYTDQLINLKTGQPVTLINAHWDVYQSFWGRTVTCTPMEWNGSTYTPIGYQSVVNSFYAASTGEQSGFVGTRFGLFGGDGGTNEQWHVIDGELSVTGDWRMTIYNQLEVIQPTDAGTVHVRSWHSSESYTACWDTGGLVGPYNSSERRDLLPLDPATIQDNGNNQTEGTSATTNTDSTTNNTDTPTNSDQPELNNTSGTSGGGSTDFASLLSIFLLLTACRRRFIP